ncbi:unnamed protein product [Lymnaea stagnalis]|uniref:Glutaminyl-peptide cyclotransferase n=1 Tax=Lymnaea stagnalis TaxID=6523 RepID=A0AAV2HKR0_LYMST
METSRRQRCHVGLTSVAVTMLMLWLLLAVVLGSSSSMLFDSSQTQTRSPSCIPWLSQTDVRQLTTGMSNMTYLYDHLLPNIMVPRVSGTPGNAVVREFIKDEMTGLGWYVEEDQFRDVTPFGEISFSNVIATLNPSAANRIVFACHYDSKLLTGFVAASDSAVPCSIMLDTARWIGQLADRALSDGDIDFTLQMLFFDGEEAFVSWTSQDSLYGSRHLASLWQQSPDRNDPTAVNNLQNINFFTLLDLIGPSDTSFVNYYANTSLLFNRLVTIEQCLKRTRLMVRGHNRVIFKTRGVAQSVEDDHTPFIQRGVPVLHLISAPFPSVWHTVHDNLRSLNRALVNNFARILRVFIASLLTGS